MGDATGLGKMSGEYFSLAAARNANASTCT
jgi:hypothetical protein